MDNLFRAYHVSGSPIPAYFIESTALNNVDDKPEESNQPPHQDLSPLEPDDAIDRMAEHLARAEQPEVVVIVHGFNNPQKAVLERYAQAFEEAAKDGPISARAGLVCLGYRWPSEKMLQPLATSYSAAPVFLIWLSLFAMLFLAIALAWPYLFGPDPTHLRRLSYTLVWLLLAVPLAVSLLRLAVYFRDGYRATNYGVPDLVDVIRQLDSKLTEKADSRGRAAKYKNPVKLSFIGHSMGGFVVTNAVRILSDVFSPPDPRAPESDHISVAQFAEEKGYVRAQGLNAGNVGKESTQKIGKAFTLAQLVLVSPDIPAETLLSNRNNSLASSLRRFSEAYLFSNGGDEVLLQISTIANYFSFPTRSRDHGLRLGNTEALADCYGVANLESLKARAGDIDEDSFLRDLRVGRLTLKELFDQIKDKRQKLLPQIFTYFDCTDYIEDGVGVLTRATPKPRVRRQDCLSAWGHIRLLYYYLFHHQKPDVHSGYFNACLARQLILRVACLGLADTLRAYHDEMNSAGDRTSAPLEAFSRVCAEKQIKVLLSPWTFQSLQKKEKASRVKMM